MDEVWSLVMDSYFDGIIGRWEVETLGVRGPLGEVAHWGQVLGDIPCPQPVLFSPLPGYHEVNSFALPCAPHHDALPQLWPTVWGQVTVE
jgi:hypothetical protein